MREHAHGQDHPQHDLPSEDAGTLPVRGWVDTQGLADRLRVHNLFQGRQSVENPTLGIAGNTHSWSSILVPAFLIPWFFQNLR